MFQALTIIPFAIKVLHLHLKQLELKYIHWNFDFFKIYISIYSRESMILELFPFIIFQATFSNSPLSYLKNAFAYHFT